MLDGFNRVVVTGGRGFIGRHLVAALVALDKDVVVVDRATSSSSVSSARVPPEASALHTDIRDPGQVEQALQGADLVFHVAANASGTRSIAEPRWDFETNSVGTFNVVQAASAVGAERLVYLSSASAYGRPQRFPMDEDHPLHPFVPYGASKLAGELTCRVFYETFGLSCVMGRPFCVYGPGEDPASALVEVSRYVRWHLRGEPIQVVGDADRKTRDFVHVSDVVAGLLLLADRGMPGEVYNLGSGEEWSMRQLVDLIGQATGRTPLVKEILDIGEDTYRLVGDITKLRGLGFSPSTRLADGVADLVARLGPSPEAPGGVTIFRPGQQAER
ncbi:MAG: NAD-dependent epimerase/dehydratase family protein [Acidimicrobiales bacterium]